MIHGSQEIDCFLRRCFGTGCVRSRDRADGPVVPARWCGCFGQMMAWFGIAYYALTDDPRWFIAGVVIFLASFAIFPIRQKTGI